MPTNTYIFNLQFENKIKNAGINKAFEKYCLVI